MRLLECSASIVFMRKFGRLVGYYDAYGQVQLALTVTMLIARCN